ncbi:AAA ATPase midasin [Teratosphaeriaceae sp. CCFEE 6253]|nr:AAA ATPase midasin [Teratosphaeriaceae sp. CCFEE 6253]
MFEWVDGSLVQAMREGAFFLLDEISLADDAVLERINSVLEPQRSILLAEKGTTDSFVTASAGFQLFATMNPGGDYGKRELSPALRNRFTEIWVPPLSDTDDIVEIMSAKLAPHARQHATAMVAFAQWFKERYNTSAGSSISIRDSLAWLEFVNALGNDNVAAAIVHGAAMVYIDTLGANPAGLMTSTDFNLGEERAACLNSLSHLLGIDANAIYSAPVNMIKDHVSLAFGSFAISTRDLATNLPTAFTFDAQTTRCNAMRVVRAMQLSKPILLEGSPGVGKTALVSAIATAAGVPLTRINLSEQTDLLDLFGSDAPVEGAAAGTFIWRDAPFLRAMKNGEWVLLDEMNLASQSVLEGLNATLDHRGEVFLPELGQTFAKHTGFRLFAAQNPHQQGGGRKGLPASFVNRFTVVYADAFHAEDLMLICRQGFPQVPLDALQQIVRFVSLLDREVTQRRSFGASGGPWEFNLRDISRWLALMTSDDGLLKSGNARDFVRLLFTQRFRSAADRTSVTKLFESVFPDSLSASDLFSSISPHDLQLGLALLPRHATRAAPTNATVSNSRSSDHLRLFESVMLCVQQRWPVIITGPSGCGKTALIEGLAANLGTTVTTIAMNADTDAMDLIGGYEQSDPIRQSLHAVTQLRMALAADAKNVSLNDCSYELVKLLAATEARPMDVLRNAASLQDRTALLGGGASESVLKLAAIVETIPAAVDKARFKWTDGLLIEALEQGKWLVLDNANLCSPSVLDRLNSLLEPDGVLVINEHAEADGSPRVIRPHPDFRVFMTVDPRYGELSRAMRNRAVELYLPTPDPARTMSAMLQPLQPESAVARFCQLKAVDHISDPDLLNAVLRVAQDHQSIADQRLTPRFTAQGGVGLYEAGRSFSKTMLAPRLKSLAPLAGFHVRAMSQAQASADFASVQVSQSAANSNQLYSQASTLAVVHDFTSPMTMLLDDVAICQSKPSVIRQLQRCERAAVGRRKPTGVSTGLLVAVDHIIRLKLRCLSEIDTVDLQHLGQVYRRCHASPIIY